MLVLVPVVNQPIHALDLEGHKLELGALPQLWLIVNREMISLSPTGAALLNRLLLAADRNRHGPSEYEAPEGPLVGGVPSFVAPRR